MEVRSLEQHEGVKPVDLLRMGEHGFEDDVMIAGESS